jgi:nucleoside-diphosphate-sugar epimerase
VRVLITGANSFIGTNFRNHSKFSDIDEISLLVNKPEEIEFSKYDLVLHLAAIVHQSKKIPENEYFKINRDLCLTVARYSKKAGIRQFILLSTIKVYGNRIKNTELRNEESECFPDDAYGKSKFEAEIGLKKLEDENFIVSIIRTPLVYGEGVKANMISLIKLVDAIPILPFGSIYNKRNFTFVENLVGYIDRIIEVNASGVFIAMDDKALSTTELIMCLSKCLGKRIRLFKLPGLFIRIGSFILPAYFDRFFGSMEFSNQLTKVKLNYNPPFSTEEGLEKMIGYYLVSKNKSR